MNQTQLASFLSTVHSVHGDEVTKKCEQLAAQFPEASPNVVLAKATEKTRNIEDLKKPIDTDFNLTYRGGS